MDGIEFLKKVRRSGNTIPFILFTGRGREEVVIQALNEGADFYLQKGGEPVSQFTELAHKIRQSVQQRQAEIMIRDHERREADIINFLPDATFAIDINGIVIAWNHAVEEMTGVEKAKVLGKGNYEYSIPFYGDRRPVVIDLVKGYDEVVAEQYPGIIKEGDNYIAEIFLQNFHGGKGAFFRIIASPLYDSEGNITGAIESVRDITTQVKVENTLRESEEKYRTVFENTGNATMVIEENCIISLANNEFAHLSGFSKDEIEGKMKWTEFVTIGDRERMLNQHRLRRESPEKALTSYEFRFVTKSGNVRTICATIDIIPGTKLSIASLHDITDRKKGEEALNLENQRIESLLSLNQMNTRTDSEITAQVVEDAIRLTGSTIGYLATLNDEESVMTMQYWSRSAHETCKIVNKPIVYAVEKTGLWGEAVRQRKSVITNDYASENPLKRGSPKGHVPLVRHMNIPVFDGNHVVAIAGVGNKDTDYNEGDVHELQLLMQGWWQILVRKRAEEDIRRSNMILKTQQETSPDGILTVDERRKVLYYNQTFVAIWKMPIDLLESEINEPVLQHMAGEVADQDTFLTRVQDVYDQKEAKSFEDLLLKDGRILEWFSAPILGEKEEYFGRVWFFRDITKRKMAENAVLAAEEKFSTICLQSPDIIWISELESGRFIDVNDAAERIFGYTREEFLGRTSFDLGIWVNPDDRAVLVQGIRKEGRVDRSGTILRRKNGEMFNAECSASTILLNGTEYLIITIRDISGMKQAEESVRKSFAILKGVVESPKDVVIFALDRQYRYIAFNENHRRTMKQIWGADIILGNSMLDYMRLPEDREKAVINFDRALAGESFSVTEVYGDTAFERRWYEDTYNPVMDENGNIIGLTLFLTDITGRKLVEEALRESEQKYRLIAENTADSIWIFDMDFRLQYISPSVEKMRGFTVEEAMALPLDRHITSDSLAVVRCLFEKEMEREESGTEDPHRSVSFETEEYCRDGSTILVENSVTLLRDAAGRLTGILGISRDITERKHAEMALRESEQKFREIFNNINDGIELHEMTEDGLPGNYLEVNDVICRMLGCPREELLQHSPLDFAIEYDNHSIEERGREILTTGHSRIEARHRNKDGEVIQVEINAHLIVLHGKTMVLSVVRDITGRKLAD
jgi:PAS domain S-box-containing protein